MIKVLPVFRTLLLSKSAISSEVGTRCYVESIPYETCDSWATRHDVEKTILINGDGDVDTNGPVATADIEVLCFAPSGSEAETLAGIVTDAIDDLSHETHDSVKVAHVDQITTPEMDRDPDTEWQFCLVTFSVMMIE